MILLGRPWPIVGIWDCSYHTVWMGEVLWRGGQKLGIERDSRTHGRGLDFHSSKRTNSANEGSTNHDLREQNP